MSVLSYSRNTHTQGEKKGGEGCKSICETLVEGIDSKDFFAAPSPFRHQAKSSACYSSRLHSTLFHAGLQKQQNSISPNRLSASATSSVFPSPLPASLQVNCGQVLGGFYVGSLSSISQKANSLTWTRSLAPLLRSLAYLHPPALARSHLPGGLRDPGTAPLPAEGRTHAELSSAPGPASPRREVTGVE